MKEDVWKKIYDEVQSLGQMLIDSRYDKDGNPPKINLSFEERSRAERQIKRLQKRSNEYLDSIGLRPKPPKWLYKIEDKSTWKSSQHFAYNHLIQETTYVG